MARSTLHLGHSLTQYYKKGTPFTTSQKSHPTQMAPHKNGISQKQRLTKIASQKLTLLVF